MRLTAIKLAGFKSFVEPTTIQFPTNLMAVVGPNGCGKSNIIDAVRWVMGEISARQLRGESMADVIFSGSSARKPVGTATVELVFDNTDGRAGGEYAEYNEISVRRQVSRDGQSAYFLNGTKCRRKDITDLFLGTGLGPRSYAIIEQGMISQIVEARPEDLRGFLEEAAGISRYKERRRETENRIRHTRENLERLSDLREEVTKQLDKLKRQSRAAERYRKYKRQYRQEEARLLALRWREQKAESEQTEKALKGTENALQEALAAQRGAEKELESLRQGQHQAREETSKIQAEVYDVGSQIARLEQDIEHQRELRKRQQTEYEETETRLNEVRQHLQLDKAQVEEITGALAELEPALEARKQAETEAVEALEAAEQALAEWQQGWQQHQESAAEADRRVELLRVRIEHLDERMGRSSERLEALKGDSGDQASQRLDKEKEELEKKLAAAEKELAAARADYEKQRNALRSLQEEIEAGRNGLEDARSRRQERSGKLESLRVLNREGDDGKALEAWCESNGLDGSRRLLDELQVEEKWTRAAEVALDAWLQAVAVDEFSPAAGGELPDMDLLLVETRPTRARPGTLAEKVGQCGRLAGWLGTVHRADDADQAREKLTSLEDHESVITPDGIWMGPGWLRRASGESARSGVIDRAREIRDLEGQIRDDDKEIERLEAELSGQREKAGEMEQSLGRSEHEGHEHQRRCAELRGQLATVESRLKDVEKRREAAREERESLEKRLAEDTEAVAVARRDLEKAMDEMAGLEKKREPLQAELRKLTEARDQARARAREAREAREKVALDLNARRTSLESLRQSIGRSDQQIAQLQERYLELSEALARGEQPVKEKQTELDGRLAERMKVEGRLKEARKRLEALEERWREHDQARMKAVAEVDRIREEQSQSQLKLKEMELKVAGLAERIEELDGDLQALVADLPDEADLEEWRNSLESLEEKIRKLEPVNLAAIEEYEQEKERKEYLDAQNADLEEALTTLEQAISRIDRTTRTRFKETFERVNKGLEELFPRLFGGGHAYLELVGDDLLTAGVAILARPPGKRIARIHLLSGGEKALAAVAFVFSIFNLNPAPFCLLDEVDAPLDDANVSRFSDMVREMSERVQFVMVTHNKVTMEVAHQMVGITMREPGVSRLVSVDLEKALEMAEA